jgi:hypothetical protein
MPLRTGLIALQIFSGHLRGKLHRTCLCGQWRRAKVTDGSKFQQENQNDKPSHKKLTIVSLTVFSRVCTLACANGPGQHAVHDYDEPERACHSDAEHDHDFPRSTRCSEPDDAVNPYRDPVQAPPPEGKSADGYDHHNSHAAGAEADRYNNHDHSPSRKTVSNYDHHYIAATDVIRICTCCNADLARQPAHCNGQPAGPSTKF